MRRKTKITGFAAFVSLMATVPVLALAPASLASSSAQNAHAPAGPAVAAPPLAAPVLTRATITNINIDSVLSYWTKARMAAAEPVTGMALASGAKPVHATATGNPGFAGGYAPRHPARISRPAVMPNTASRASVAPADGPYPGPNNTFQWMGSYRTWPVSTVGKLFFTEPSGDFVCSAAATYGGGTLDMVWTAGHCVGAQGGRAYYKNWLFCPSYQNGPYPGVGCWSWRLAQQTGGWYYNGYWSADYAYLLMQPISTMVGNHVVSVNGGLSFAWNWPRDQAWMDFGYPAQSPYNGGSLVVSAAEHRYDLTNPGNDPGPADNSIGSAQTPGFSGGPWILSFGGTNGINSDNSYYLTNPNQYGKEIQGPYYDANACNFWKLGSGWTGSC